MKYSKTITHHIGMGEYEWVELSVTVEADQADLEGGFAEDVLDNEIDALLKRDLAKARKNTARDDSYILDWKD